MMPFLKNLKALVLMDGSALKMASKEWISLSEVSHFSETKSESIGLLEISVHTLKFKIKIFHSSVASRKVFTISNPTRSCARIDRVLRVETEVTHRS